MNLKRFSMLLIAMMSYFVVGCMDVSPPEGVSQNGKVILHSVRLPFERAIYGVGDVDTVRLTAALMNGDTVPIDPRYVEWKISPVQAATSVDSVGVLTTHSSSASLANNGVKLIASYSLNGITKIDTASIYITNRRFDIKSFELRSADSARGGGMSQSFAILGILLRQYIDLPRLNLEIKDIYDSVPNQINLNNHFGRFLTSTETGKRFGKQKIAINVPTIYPNGLYVMPTAPVGDYWIGLEAYMYGKNLKDSVLFKQMQSGEILFLANVSGTNITVRSNISVVQPCATALINNQSRDTVLIELPPANEDCEGNGRHDGGVLRVAPGYRGRLRVLGYKDGTRVQWRAFRAVNPSQVIDNGAIELRLTE